MTDYQKYFIGCREPIRKALIQMNDIGKKMLLVMSDEKFVSILSIGDIQRAIISDLPLNTRIEKILRNKTRFAYIDSDEDEIKKTMLEMRIEYMPVLNKDMTIDHVIEWEDAFEFNIQSRRPSIDNLLIVMAGGEGVRLRPITSIIPKALMPIKDKPIIQEIIERFSSQGVNEVVVLTNYKSEMIEGYFRNDPSGGIVSVVKEAEPRGTAGALSLVRDRVKDTFILTNCDIIIEQDYHEILKYHRENKNALTIVSALKTIAIPYGVLVTENGMLKRIDEKPEITYQINTGLYIMEPEVLRYIPPAGVFDITHLIEEMSLENDRIGVFPVPETSWFDMGDWDEYVKMRAHLKSKNQPRGD